jgi:hypothetical protein
VSIIRRLFTALSTVAVFVAIGAAIVIVVISKPASYVTSNPDSSAGPSDGSGGPALENVIAGIEAISPYLPYLSLVVAFFLSITLGVRLRDRRRLAKRRAADAFIQIDRTTMGGKSDDLIRTWEEASAPQTSRGFFGLFRRRPAATAVFGEERPGFFARLFRRAPKAEVQAPVDPFDPYVPVDAPAPIEVVDATPSTPRRRRPLAVVLAVLAFVTIALGLAVAGVIALFGWAGVGIPTTPETLNPAIAELRAVLDTQIAPRDQLAAAIGAAAVALLVLAGLLLLCARIARLGARPLAESAPAAPAAPTELPDGDAEHPYRLVDFDEPAAPVAPAAPAAPAVPAEDFAALFDDAIGAAPAAPQPTAPVADFVLDEGFTDPAAWGQAAGSAAPAWQTAARPGVGDAVRPEPGSAELTPRPETALTDPDLTRYVPRRRHRIELLIGVVGGLIAGVAVALVDTRALLETIVGATAGIDPSLLTTVVATVSGALVALLIVGAVRLVRRPRPATAPASAPLRRGRALAVALLWIALSLGLLVGAGLAIGATDVTTFVARLTEIITAFDTVTSLVIALIAVSFLVGFIGMAAATIRRAATPSSLGAEAIATPPGTPAGRRLVRGVVFLLCLLIAGVIAGAGAVRLGRGIADVPSAVPIATPSPSATPSVEPSEAPIAEGWTIVEPEQGGWRIGFPAAPQVNELLTPSTAGELTSTTYSIAVGGTSYAIVITDYPTGTIDGTNPDTIDGAVRGAAEQVDGEVTSTRTLTIDGAPGREAVIRAGETEFRTRIYLVGSRLIQLIVGYSAVAAPVEAAAFIDSFAIVPIEATPSPSPSSSPSPAPSTPPDPSTSPGPSGSPSAHLPRGNLLLAYTGRPVGVAALLTAHEAVFFHERAVETTAPPAAATVLPLASIRPSGTAALTLRGRATHYDATKNNAWYTRSTPGSAYYHQDGGPYLFYAAASPRLRAIAPFYWGKPPYRVIVTNTALNLSIVAWIVDECACVGGGIIDIGPEAWWVLGGSGRTPYSRGVIDVLVEIAK